MISLNLTTLYGFTKTYRCVSMAGRPPNRWQQKPAASQKLKRRLPLLRFKSSRAHRPERLSKLSGGTGGRGQPRIRRGWFKRRETNLEGGLGSRLEGCQRRTRGRPGSSRNRMRHYHLQLGLHPDQDPSGKRSKAAKQYVESVA